MTAVPKQGWLFLIEFINGISRNTGKCKLGGFFLRQSQIVTTYTYYFTQMAKCMCT